MTISSGADSSDVEFEANDSLSDAQPVSLNQPYEGQLSGMSDVDYYKFSVDQRVKLSIAFSSEKSTGLGRVGTMSCWPKMAVCLALVTVMEFLC